MEIIATVEWMSELKTRKFTNGYGESQEIEEIELVLNSGLERIACTTSTSGQARSLQAMGLKKGDNVVAMLCTQCGERRTSDGTRFWANNTRLIKLAPVSAAADGENTRRAG